MKKLLPKTINNPQGFTLVELLVVISIIAILALIGFAVYSSTQARARDGRREADISAFAAGTESNYVEGSITPYNIAKANYVAGIFPTEPSNTSRQYCLYSGNAATGNPVRGTNAPTAGWAVATCPAIAGAPAAVVVTAAMADIPNQTWFKICALKEQTVAVTCKDNAR